MLYILDTVQCKKKKLLLEVLQSFNHNFRNSVLILPDFCTSQDGRGKDYPSS